jgi:hypothetical protein
MYLQMRHPHMEYPRIELWGIVVGVVHAEGYRDRGVIPSKDSSKPIKVLMACHEQLNGRSRTEEMPMGEWWRNRQQG